MEQIVLLGDIFDTGQHLHETVKLLRDVNAVGVWGNHEIGLCLNPDLEITERYGADIVQFFGSLRPNLAVKDILFSHGIPTWDAADPSIYYTGSAPWETDSLLPVFAGFSHRLFLIGHFHRWFMATTGPPVKWDGTQSVILDAAERFFVIVHAVTNGWCAILDTDTSEFTPCFIG